MGSRIANSPITVPSGVDIKLDGLALSVKGKNGQMEWMVHPAVAVKFEENTFTFAIAGNDKLIACNVSEKKANALAGTTRALVNNMVKGVVEGFGKKLTLVGVGYRAQLQGKNLNLTLGFSHPVVFAIPEGIKIECPSQTEVVITGMDKQKVGQVAANIRAYRPPEPYKGKGVRYHDERIVLKEGKKK